MASVQSSYVQLAKTLHPRLLKFFARYPPRVSSAGAPGAAATTLNTSSADANHVPSETPSAEPLLQPSKKNPFVPKKSPLSGRWQGPVFSLRQQSDLYKLAAKQGVAELLPYTPKNLAERTRKREELGLRVKGTGVGQRVKGHVQERYLGQRLEKRKTAMKRMGGLIRFWRLVSVLVASAVSSWG